MNYHDRSAHGIVDRVEGACAPAHAHQSASTGLDKQQVKALAAHCGKYRGANTKRAALQVATTLLPLLGVIALMIWATHADLYWLALLLALPAAGLVVRTFIIQHDCGHGSFLPDSRANNLLGRMVSVLTVTPYGLWRRAHAKHHATSGNLGRRGCGDIKTLTVKEYAKLNWLQRLRYRVYRHPFFLFVIGAPLFFLLVHRVPWLHPFPPRDVWRSVIGLDLGLVASYGAVAWLVGPLLLLKVMLPIIVLAAAIGGWLFFVQHQFEDTHWDEDAAWDYQVAAVNGSSYYALPPVLQWFTGNIGLHHIHHLCAAIPNYRLQECLDASPQLQQLNRLTLRESLGCARLALWDEDKRQLIGFNDVSDLAAVRQAALRDGANRPAASNWLS